MRGRLSIPSRTTTNSAASRPINQRETPEIRPSRGTRRRRTRPVFLRFHLSLVATGASVLTDLGHVINGGRCHVAESRLRIEDGIHHTGFPPGDVLGQGTLSLFAARYARPFDEAQINQYGTGGFQS